MAKNLYLHINNTHGRAPRVWMQKKNAIIYKMRAQVAIANDANDANGHKGTRVPCC